MAAQWVKLFLIRQVYEFTEKVALSIPKWRKSLYLKMSWFFFFFFFIWRWAGHPNSLTERAKEPRNEISQKVNHFQQRLLLCLPWYKSACSGKGEPKVRTLEWRSIGELQFTAPAAPASHGAFESQSCWWYLCCCYLLFHSGASLRKTICLDSQSGTPTHAQLPGAVSPGCWWALIWWHYHLFALHWAI